MQDKKPDQNRATFNDDAMPSIVDGILVFFYVVLWLNVVLVSLPILNPGQDNTLRYLLPLLAYACLFVSFPVRNWRRFRRGEGKLSDLLWGYYDQSVHRFVFVLINFAIVAWLSALNDNFVSLYFGLLGLSAG